MSTFARSHRRHDTARFDFGTGLETSLTLEGLREAGAAGPQLFGGAGWPGSPSRFQDSSDPSRSDKNNRAPDRGFPGKVKSETALMNRVLLLDQGRKPEHAAEDVGSSVRLQKPNHFMR